MAFLSRVACDGGFGGFCGLAACTALGGAQCGCGWTVGATDGPATEDPSDIDCSNLKKLSKITNMIHIYVHTLLKNFQQCSIYN